MDSDGSLAAKATPPPKAAPNGSTAKNDEASAAKAAPAAPADPKAKPDEKASAPADHAAALPSTESKKPDATSPDKSVPKPEPTAIQKIETTVKKANKLVVWGIVGAVFLFVGVVIGYENWSPPERIRVQGYVEGEFVYVSSQLAGPLQSLHVQRGMQVQAGDALFELDPTVEKAGLDLAKASLTFSERDFERQEQLGLDPGSASVRDLQLSRSARDQDSQRLASADWNYTQKFQSAPQGGLVFDTLYRVGEWVDAGHPVVVLLPPSDIEVRAFVPETQIGRIHPGDLVQVFVDGVKDPFKGTMRYIFPQAEYTPPVIYSQESRSKLVFMVEIDFDPETAAKLHPGQPVDVQFGP